MTTIQVKIDTEIKSEFGDAFEVGETVETLFEVNLSSNSSNTNQNIGEYSNIGSSSLASTNINSTFDLTSLRAENSTSGALSDSVNIDAMSSNDFTSASFTFLNLNGSGSSDPTLQSGDLFGSLDALSEFTDSSAIFVTDTSDAEGEVTGITLSTDLLPDGDYNFDGIVDAADYSVWRDALGSTDARADGNNDGVVDAGDYDMWVANYGAVAATQELSLNFGEHGTTSFSASPQSFPASVPEPSSSLLAGAAIAAYGLFNGFRKLLKKD